MRLAPAQHGADPLAQPARRLLLLAPDRRQHTQHVLAADPVDRHRLREPGTRTAPVSASMMTVCLALRHRGLWASCAFSAACRKVGVLRRRFSASGSPPSRASFLLPNAASRASAKLTSGYPPRPMSQRRPSTVTRCTQDFDPLGVTCRNSVSSARYLPGFAIAFASAAVIRFTRPLFPPEFPRSVREYMGTKQHLQACLRRKTPLKASLLRTRGNAKTTRMVPHRGDHLAAILDPGRSRVESQLIAEFGECQA